MKNKLFLLIISIAMISAIISCGHNGHKSQIKREYVVTSTGDTIREGDLVIIKKNKEVQKFIPKNEDKNKMEIITDEGDTARTVLIIG